MIASCAGDLETGNSEEEEDASANVINDFIYQGANLHNQTDRTGETALHLAAALYARSDAAKRLLRPAPTPTSRTTWAGRRCMLRWQLMPRSIPEPCHDLDARMHDGTTPLILAARLAVEGMVEELINCHADVNAIDDLVTAEPQGYSEQQGGNASFLGCQGRKLQTAKVLLDHFANREITDHMDRLPRDIAQERMHHDIVRLLMDEYNLVRSPPMHGGSLSTTLSAPLSARPTYLGSMKQPQPQVKAKAKRHAPARRHWLQGRQRHEAEKNNSQDGKSGNLLDSSAVLSPVDSLESPHGYVSADVASPPMMTSPFQQSPSVSLNHLQACPTPPGCEPHGDAKQAGAGSHAV
ncbi:hypothetical protein INR49_030240 [Caranx melampygus]|nr:hypothetical protein INR49_030240 [Caranx melampygus]